MNLNQYEKSKGIVLFAFNTAKINYVKIADLNAKLIRHNLNLPVTLVTDIDSSPAFSYDNVLRINQTKSNFRYNKSLNRQEWKNVDRYLAYELSPYFNTLVLDIDYMQFDSSLSKIFDIRYDYKLQYDMITPDGPGYAEMGPQSLPQVWATSIFFRKTEKTKNLFTLVQRIQDNYEYYRALFNIKESNFRNDFAFSIANIILNGYNIDPELNFPWPLFTIEKDIKSISLVNQNFVIRYDNNADVVPITNIHFMDKNYLLTDKFAELVKAITNE